MMSIKSAVLLVLFAIVAINAQSVGIASTSAAIKLGVWSPWYTITANDISQLPYNVRFVDTNTNNPEVEFSATTFAFNSQVRTLSFRVRSTFDISTIVTVESDHVPSADRPWAQYQNSIQLNFVNRTITLDDFIANKVNTNSQPQYIRVDVAPTTGDLQITPTANNTAITFSPATIVIKQGSLSGEFTWKSSIYGVLVDRVTFTVAGPEADLYWKEALETNYVFDVEQNDWQVRVSGNPNFLLGANTVNNNAFYVYAEETVQGTIVVTPQAADVTFSPSSVSLNAQTRTALFNITTVNPNSNSVRQVNLFTTGDFVSFPFAGTNPILAGQTAISVPKRTITVTKTSNGQDLTINNVTYISLAISAPVNSGLTVTLSAAKLGFNASGWQPTTTVTFSGAQTSIVVAVLAQQLGADNVYLTLGGADAEIYNFASGANTQAVPYNVIKAFFTSPDVYGATSQLFWVGTESAPIPVRAAISPVDSVTIRLFAPNVKFNPEILRFRNGTEQQYFTVTPLYTNKGISQSYSTYIEYLLDGPNFDHYDPIAATPITVNQRYFQNEWSAHLNTDDSSTGTLHLHKTYKVWSTVNYIAKGEQVSLTPVSPYFSFSPKVLNFHGSTNRILFEATVTGVPVSGNAIIDYIVGGKEGGLYYPAESQPVTIGLRPLEIVGAVVSQDERTREKKAVLLTNGMVINSVGSSVPYTGFSPSKLSEYHVYSFLIRSFALPDNDLTITPQSPHISFSPSKITLKAANAVKRIDFTAEGGNLVDETVTYTFNSTGVYAEANFSVEAHAAGTHYVSFALSGSDKDYYARIPDVGIKAALVMRHEAKDFPVSMSSSSSLFPSFVVAAVIAAFALVL